MRKQAARLAVLALGAALGGCGALGSAPIEVVRQDSTGGELVLRGTVVAAHHAAEDEILAHCAGRARIVSVVREPEVAVATASTPARGGGDRLRYVCLSRAARATADRRGLRNE